MSLFDLAAQNLLSPMVLFFVLGVLAALARSDLSVPEAIAKGLSLYLMMAIGFKGGAGVAAHGADGKLVLALAAGVVLSATLPFMAFALLRAVTSLPRVDAAAVAAHYGSISIVTFLAGSQALTAAGIPFEGYMVAVAAAMEAPAIFVALWLASGSQARLDTETLRDVAMNGSIVILLGAFAIGCITGAKGLEAVAPFLVEPFKGILCLFLLDMGLIAGRGLAQARKHITLPLAMCAVILPILNAGVAWGVALVIGLTPGGAALLMILAASASYIAVPAALRLALPQANPAISLTVSLGITFPFNLTVGIPLYIAVATLVLK
jgi:uncharacterized protein